MDIHYDIETLRLHQLPPQKDRNQSIWLFFIRHQTIHSVATVPEHLQQPWWSNRNTNSMIPSSWMSVPRFIWKWQSSMTTAIVDISSWYYRCRIKTAKLCIYYVYVDHWLGGSLLIWVGVYIILGFTVSPGFEIHKIFN